MVCLLLFVWHGIVCYYYAHRDANHPTFRCHVVVVVIVAVELVISDFFTTHDKWQRYDCTSIEPVDTIDCTRDMENFRMKNKRHLQMWYCNVVELDVKDFSCGN